MLKQIGRLDRDDIREINEILQSIFEMLDNGNKEEAEKKLINMAKTPNYFIREEIGKILPKYSDQRKIMPIAKKMLKHKFYGVRASALFYFYNRYLDTPEKILEVLDEIFESIPWEAESIVNDLWKKYPEVMKKEMVNWIKSDNEKKRAISFHGMENIARQDPVYIMEFISHAIDDTSMEVQKKITHILTQVARSRPAECYPYIREWLTSATDKRMKTLWVSMKKLANIVIQKSRRDKSQEFIMLTHQTINDWKYDENEQVSYVGKKLSHIINR